jgi:hypothetical protein
MPATGERAGTRFAGETVEGDIPFGSDTGRAPDPGWAYRGMDACQQEPENVKHGVSNRRFALA